MKKFVSLLICAVFLLSALPCFAKNTTGTPLNIDGEIKYLVAYNIRGNNYFKLRDVANVLKGTSAQFDVVYNYSKEAVEMISGTAYSTDEPLSTDILHNPTAYTTSVPIYKDGIEVIMGAYNIEGNNYFKLRDIASVINFGVDWNPDTKIIDINTSKDYVYPQPADNEISVNPFYFSYASKTKAEADALLGEGTYDMEFGVTTYNNGIKIGWGSIGSYPDDSSTPMCIYLPLEKIFYNCPDVVTVDMLKKVFPYWHEGFSEMDGTSSLGAEYCGKILTFYTDEPMTKTSRAFFNLSNRYSFITTHSFNIETGPVTPQKTHFKGSPTGFADYRSLVNANRRYFITFNDFDIWEHEAYYVLADFDRDGQNELLVRLGFGLAIYKKFSDGVYLIYSNPIDADNYATYRGSDHQVVTAGGEYYIIYDDMYYRYNEGQLESVPKPSFVKTPEFVDFLMPSELNY